MIFILDLNIIVRLFIKRIKARLLANVALFTDNVMHMLAVVPVGKVMLNLAKLVAKITSKLSDIDIELAETDIQVCYSL